MSKKHLELTLIREVLTNSKLIQYAVEVDSTSSFKFLLKEFKVTYKETLFESTEMTKRMFQFMNAHGNIHILREAYKFYLQYYTEHII